MSLPEGMVMGIFAGIGCPTSIAVLGVSRFRGAAVVSAALVWLASWPATAADLAEARTLLHSGKYAECAQRAAGAIEEGEWREAWRVLKIEAEMAIGRYPEALRTLEDALRRYRYSVSLRLLGRRVYLYNDQPDRAKEMLGEMGALAKLSPWRYSDAAERVALGRFFLLRGADARQVLEYFYDRAKEEHPDSVEAYEASGDLALEKHDDQLAAEAFDKALKLDPDDPDLYCKLARALASGDGARANQVLETALEKNPHHVDSLLLKVDQLVDAERYDDAEPLLAHILAVNPGEPRAWAYRAVLAHLAGDVEEEESCREAGLCCWTTNPEVDHLIGLKLSQKYRFAEGAARQRQALQFDRDYLPAKTQLCQDLLRLGDEEEGWRLAEEAHQKDGYDVVAYNLVTLREKLAKFTTLEDGDLKDGGLIVRMDAREAKVYGQRVLELLRRAKQVLCAKYDVRLSEPVIVEMFPEQSDFAIRTFGLPGGAGFLGVCFGRVITANSPASQGESPSNWQSMLWHEFCHVVTLHKSGNKMPRWLSEGISVYEERQANPAWGESMNPRYREMILGEELTPVSQLSAAFLNPASPLHLQFAYYESSLVVEYLVERHGLETLQRILTDLGAGALIHDALQRHAGSLELLDQEFARFARQRAEQLAPDADWRRPPPASERNPAELAAWSQQHPNSYWGLRQLALQLAAEKKWEAAKTPLEKLLALYPGDIGPDSAYRLLAAAHRALNETDKERAVFNELASRDADAVDAYLRLMEICSAAEDWEDLAENAQRMLAVNPLVRAPHYHLARAAEELGRPQQAIEAYRSLLQLQPVDPADAHYRLARLLQQTGDLPAARREVLKSLEEAPRFRAAHRTLLEIVDSMEGSSDVNKTLQAPQTVGGNKP